MEAQVDDAREAIREFKALLETKGWKRLEEVARAQVKGRQDEVLLKPTQDTLEENYMKGEAHGIQLFVNLPKQLLEMNKDIIELAKKLEEEGS